MNQKPARESHASSVGFPPLAGDGEMARAIRAHDWAATPLGPIEDWPQSLKLTVELMLGSKAIMAASWGPEGILLYNDAYGRLIGPRSPMALGRPFFEAFPELRQVLEPQFAQVMAGRAVKESDQSYPFVRTTVPEYAWFDVSHSPVRGENGKVAGILTILTETTARRKAEAALSESEARYRTLFDSVDQGFCVIEMIFDEAGAPKDYRFVEVNSAFERQTGLVNAVGKSMRALEPHHEEHWFEIYGRIALTGEPERFERAAAQLGHHYEVYAFRVGEPHERKVGILFNDIADRKQAEARLRESEERQAFLLELGDRMREASDADAVIAAATRMLGEKLDASRIVLAEIDDAAGVANIRPGWTAEGAEIHPAVLKLADFGGPLLDDLRAGRTVRYEDIGAPPHARPDLAALAAIGIKSGLSVPLLVGGRFVGNLSVHQHEPRIWTDAEVSLVEAVAERIWASVERARAEAALRDTAARLRHIVDGATEYAIVALGPDGRIETWNSGAERLLGYAEAEVLGRSGDIFFSPEDRAAGQPGKEMQTARAEGRAENERWHVRKDGTRFWGSGVMLPLDGDGQGRFIKIFRDRTEEREAEQRQQLLINELNHRVKNTLATVQAIASQTFRGSALEAEVRDSFESRLRALAAAHDVLTQEHWQRADLRQVVGTALGPFREVEDRLRIAGPLFYLTPRAALALTMALHELATNATKYGALSTETGRVEVSWTVDDADGGRLRLRWEETGGPPVAAPARRGFGSRLIERGLAGELDARARIDYAPTGVVCTIEAPVEELRGTAPHG